MNIHIIACGGAVMHNIALALHNLGHAITGSDDEIFEPALSRLKAKGILPSEFGWFEEKINNSIDFIILGMHARAVNPELAKAKALGIKIYSFPEYVYEHAKDKIRIVIGGSHGKTTTTAMIMHVLKTLGKDFDYLVGSQLEGFDTMVRFSDAPIMVIEGDEYLTSTLDPVPKFLKYKPHFAQITGIAWDHINVFPTFEGYVHQFELFAQSILPKGKLVYFEQDEELKKIASNAKFESVSYNTPNYKIENNAVILSHQNKNYILEIFGEHNLQNMEGAKLLCENIGVTHHDFYTAMQTFTGTAKRLEKVLDTKDLIIFRDFAHSPSKLKATVDAVALQYKDWQIMAVFELHTFSSLNVNFLPQFKHCMQKASESIVYFNPHVFEHKRMEILETPAIIDGFGEGTQVISDTKQLVEKIMDFKSNVLGTSRVLLLMSSGNFDNAQLW